MLPRSLREKSEPDSEARFGFSCYEFELSSVEMGRCVGD